jgi:hypothetical protein
LWSVTYHSSAKFWPPARRTITSKRELLLSMGLQQFCYCTNSYLSAIHEQERSYTTCLSCISRRRDALCNSICLIVPLPIIRFPVSSLDCSPICAHLDPLGNGKLKPPDVADEDESHIASLSRLYSVMWVLSLLSCVNLAPADGGGSCFEGAKICNSRDTKGVHMDRSIRVRRAD